MLFIFHFFRTRSITYVRGYQTAARKALPRLTLRAAHHGSVIVFIILRLLFFRGGEENGGAGREAPVSGLCGSVGFR